MTKLSIKGSNNKTKKMKMKMKIEKKQGTRSLQVAKKCGLVGCLKGAFREIYTKNKIKTKKLSLVSKNKQAKSKERTKVT